MSTEEQDAIVGRILREHAEAKKLYSLLCAETEHAGDYLTALGHALRTHHSLSSGSFGSFSGEANLDKFPTSARLVELVKSTAEAKTNKGRLADRLRELGHEDLT